jgi:hypothetical protein
MVLDNADERATPDPSLLRIIARAHDMQARLNKNSELAVHDIAREERVTAAYIYTLLRLPWLALDITAAIATGRQPSQLNAMTLMRKASRLPVDWREQRTPLGFVETVAAFRWGASPRRPQISRQKLNHEMAPQRFSSPLWTKMTGQPVSAASRLRFHV